ncbi:hypothetical protein [Citrobacter sp. wls708]|uniref:hypothetical protein n=1 Tax=Citrobacter sp. wls708 TaxID=2576427 RepID=UPI0010CA1B22|nr:hypothetical protein [Citrobacter sp. wls708]TKU84162.1 hypothetical protein FDW97_12980 [Citrobacter sp. wls708]
MKCQNANNFFFPALSAFTLFFTFTAHARIENTVIANYDLTTGKNVHYELIASSLDKSTTITLVPLEQNNKMPSTFKVALCINHYTGSYKQGEFHFSTTKTDQNDSRMANFGAFVTEHNLHTWWLHITPQQNLIFTRDVGGLLITDPSVFNFSTKACQQN